MIVYPELPFVSVLIPTYNQENHLGKAISSALEQNYPNLEVIVVDDCSSYDIQIIIDQYLPNPKLKYYKNKTNIGRVANYRKCLYEYATGDWAICLDGDDFLTESNYISFCVSIVKDQKNKNRNIVFIQSGDKLIDVEKKISKDRLPHIPGKALYIIGTDYFLNFLTFKHFSHLGTFYNRQRAIECGFYSHDILSSDIESCLKLAMHGDVVLLKQVAGVWLHHGSNASQLSNIEMQLDNLNWISECKMYAMKTHPELASHLKRWNKKVLNASLIAVMNFLLISQNSVRHLLKQVKILFVYIIRKAPLLFFNPIFIFQCMKVLLRQFKKNG